MGDMTFVSEKFLSKYDMQLWNSLSLMALHMKISSNLLLLGISNSSVLEV